MDYEGNATVKCCLSFAQADDAGLVTSNKVLQDSAFLGMELNALPGFQQAIARKLNKIIQDNTQGVVIAVNFKTEVMA